jgi:hypothetical protein
MSDQNRVFGELNSYPDKFEYQKFRHSPLDVLRFYQQTEGSRLTPDSTVHCGVRIVCPDVRVISRVAIIFVPKVLSTRTQYNLATLSNTIVAYRCIDTELSLIARVGEIVGKNGVPKQFPLSDIDGFAFEDSADNPYIDLELELGFPGVEGAWVCEYHCTSNNKLKREEWNQFISRVSMTVTAGPSSIGYGAIGGR